MGRSKEPEPPPTNPVEAKKFRDEANGHFKTGFYERALAALDKVYLESYYYIMLYIIRQMCLYVVLLKQVGSR